MCSRPGCGPSLRTRRAPARPPTHPCAVLREAVLPALGPIVSATAWTLGVTRRALHDVLSERAAVSAAMALRLGKLCGNGPRPWLAMQTAHDLWHAEREGAEALAAIPTLRAAS